MAAQSSTRRSKSIFGLGSCITANDKEITGVRLPTCRQVLRSFLYHFEEEKSCDKKFKRQCAKTVVDKVCVFYKKANIPTVCDNACINKVLQLNEEKEKLFKIPKKKRESANAIQRVTFFNENLDKTFVLWPKDAKELIDNAEDKLFLISMMTDRCASFGSFDKKKLQRENKKEARTTAELSRKKKWEAERNTNTCVTAPISPSDSDSENEDQFVLHKPSRKRSHHRHSKKGTQAFIPHNILSKPSVVSVSTRLRLTPTQQKAITEAIIKESEGDCDSVSLSYASAQRARCSVNASIAKDIKDEWTPPSIATVHWGGKQLPFLMSDSCEERLAILLGCSADTKLIGVAAYPPGSDQKAGTLISERTINYLKDWDCVESVVNMCFDTTPANTGHLTAACISIQDGLDKAMLWSACRHHVGERILVEVFESLKIEASKSPDVSIFKRFQERWSSMAQDEDFTIIPVSDASNVLMDQKKKTLETLKHCKKLMREDYDELVNLCGIVLKQERKSEKPLRKPGAMHKARWMAKVLYSIKICLFYDQIKSLPKGSTVGSETQLCKLKDFVTFVCHVYCDWWLQCQSARRAPFLDLCLYKTLLKYETVNSVIAKSALRALNRHLWYLTQEMVVLALFDSNVPNKDRQDMADRLLLLKPESLPTMPVNRFGKGYGKPRFPSLDADTSLADLLGHDSWFTVQMLKLDVSFLDLPVFEWEETESYSDGLKIIKNVKVLNDSAERAVKLTTDFIDKARSEDHFQNILQVVEKERKTTPDLRRKRRKITDDTDE